MGADAERIAAELSALELAIAALQGLGWSKADILNALEDVWEDE
jgi:Holliday junction resolvasome RuvABC DNA-binding subunit